MAVLQPQDEVTKAREDVANRPCPVLSAARKVCSG
jgi:hypothetical protein